MFLAADMRKEDICGIGRSGARKWCKRMTGVALPIDDDHSAARFHESLCLAHCGFLLLHVTKRMHKQRAIERVFRDIHALMSLKVAPHGNDVL